MDRTQAHKITREILNKHGLQEWGIRIISNPDMPFLGRCMYQDKIIILNAFHIDIHPYAEVMDTIYHEVAHALCPGQGHNDVWATKAREIGCTNTFPCSHLDLPAHVIDAIRSGHMVEIVVEEKKVEQIVRNVTHKVTRLQDKCPECGKVAVELSSVELTDNDGNLCKVITLECLHLIKKILPRNTPYDLIVTNDWKPEIKACQHVWSKNQCDKCGEYRLHKFQVEGCLACETALAVQKGFGNFDDMGLGKTFQALAPLRFHWKKLTPTMVVTKSVAKFQWFQQAIRLLGPEFMAQIISTSRDFLIPGLRLYIIPYDLLRRFDRAKLHALGIKLVILDECQQIKNPDSTRTQEVRKLISANAECKIIGLSGTPWKNRGSEFFPILNLIDPLKFHSYQYFLDYWVEYYWHGNKRKMGGIKNPVKFREFVKNLIIRREYDEVMEEFPTVNRVKLPVQLDELQQGSYDDSVSEFVAWYNNAVIGGEEESLSSIEILAKMSRMRHITGLAKIPATLGFIEEFIEDTEKKLVVFVHHKDVGELLYRALTDTDKDINPDWYELAQEIEEEGVRIFKYTSAHTGKDIGYQIQEDFNNTKRCIMIASTLACGEAINLQTCADSILHERQWNPQNEDQATPGRFKRIGQESKQINITMTEAKDTIDEELDAIVERKRGRYHIVMNKGEVAKWNETEFARELAAAIVKKHGAKNKGKSITQAASRVKRFPQFIDADLKGDF